MADRMLFAGIDVGTSGCKMLVYDLDGNIIYQSSRKYQEEGSGGHRELNPEVVISKVKEVLKDVAGDCIEGITAMAVTSLGESVVCLDKNNKVLANSMLEENVKECRRAADYCHFYGIPVEAELGALRGKEEDIVNEAECKTDPDMVAEFVEKTGCDTLAVSVGNVHGLCLNPQIDIPLLEKINQISKVPLVLHGGSGIPKEVIWEAKKHGLIKINYGSDLRKEFVKTFGQAYEENHNEYDVIHLSIEAVEEVSRKAQELVTMINEH